jgi:hypothetical protein
MRQMVLLLVTVVQEPQMFFRAAEMIFDAPMQPFVIRVRGHALAHHLSDRFKGFGEGFHQLLPYD